MTNDHFKALNAISQTIFDKKGFNIIALDVRGVCTMTDFFIIAEGNVDRHVKALSQTVAHMMKEKGEQALHIEGERDADWVVLDFGYIVVHLFTSEMREKYAIEDLWRKGRIVDLDLACDRQSQSLQNDGS